MPSVCAALRRVGNARLPTPMFDITNDLDALHPLGFNPALLPALQALAPPPGSRLWRLTAIHRDRLHLESPQGGRTGRALPALTEALHARGDALAVGDW